LKRQLHHQLVIPQPRAPLRPHWLHPASSPLALTDIRYYQDLARRAEAALFDSIFLADQLALGEVRGAGARAPGSMPVTVLAAVCGRDHRIRVDRHGVDHLYGSRSTSRGSSRRLDHISNGRAAWKIVTSWLATAARNFGRRQAR